MKSLLVVVALVLLTSGCALPKIVVLHDPLSAEEHVQLGMIYQSQQKSDLAMEQYRAAVKKDKKHTKAWTLLGDLSYSRADYNEAEFAYRKVLKLEPESGDTRNNLAWVYLQQGRTLKKAKELVLEAISLNPEHKPYYLDTLGVVLLRLGNAQEAITALRESVETLPTDQPALLAEAYEHLADAYKAAGEEDNHRAAAARSEELRSKP
jgi:Tfp pilus assembly protein PilF